MAGASDKIAGSAPGAGRPLDPKHVKRLYAALKSAGLGDMKITALQLAPRADENDGQACHAVQQPDGTFKIVCN